MEVSPLQVQLAEGAGRGASARPRISLAAREELDSWAVVRSPPAGSRSSGWSRVSWTRCDREEDTPPPYGASNEILSATMASGVLGSVLLFLRPVLNWLIF